MFDPVIVGPDVIEYTLKGGPHAGRHAVQQTYYPRVGPGIETTAWYEESGALLHITWYLEPQTSHRFAAIPAWLAEDFTFYRGDNQDPAFIEKMGKLASQRPRSARSGVPLWTNGARSLGGSSDWTQVPS